MLTAGEPVRRCAGQSGDGRCGSLVGVKADADVCVFFQAHEDPMYDLIRENKRNEKETRYIRTTQSTDAA